MTWLSLKSGLLVAVSAAGPLAAQSPVVGEASVIRGDTLDIYGQRPVPSQDLIRQPWSLRF